MPSRMGRARWGEALPDPAPSLDSRCLRIAACDTRLGCPATASPPAGLPSEAPPVPAVVTAPDATALVAAPRPEGLHPQLHQKPALALPDGLVHAEGEGMDIGFQHPLTPPAAADEIETIQPQRWRTKA